MGLADTLRRATADEHRAVEDAELLRSIFRSDFDLSAYAMLLDRWASFFARFDIVLSTFCYSQYRYDCRLPRLQQDLTYLSDHVRHSMRPWSYSGWVPATRTEHLGAIYVLEGSTLGAQLICRQLSEQLGSHAAHCTAYYSMRTVHWPSFRRLLDAAQTDEEIDEHAVVGAARSTFKGLRDHMDVVTPVENRNFRVRRNPEPLQSLS